MEIRGFLVSQTAKRKKNNSKFSFSVADQFVTLVFWELKESHGEDIGNTYSEKSTHSSKEDEYEDSFIDDSEPKVSPPSPWSNGRGHNIDMEIGEMSNKKSEDGYHPTSTPNSEANVVADSGVGRDMGLPCDSMLPPNAIRLENGLELNEEIANKPAEEKTLETYSVTGYNAINEDKLQHTEEKRDNEDLLGKNGDDQNSANDKIVELYKTRITVQLYDPLLSSTDAGSNNGVKPNKRTKESAAYVKSLEGNTSNNNIPKNDSVKQNEGGAGKTIKDLDEKSETDQKSFHDKGVNLDKLLRTHYPRLFGFKIYQL
ncbi:uncharacterized protein LOC127804562 [Diospyros lotus]|uniref:uncharacterized protein LOC127804562 n=1 Tax=Diospyros lotus TaxID=55363 RepID=UPI0022555894|nr:uncharacterized protein LOC127804562 [Diospyros lotus]